MPDEDAGSPPLGVKPRPRLVALVPWREHLVGLTNYGEPHAVDIRGWRVVTFTLLSSGLPPA